MTGIDRRRDPADRFRMEDDMGEAMTPDLQSCLLCDDVRQENNGKFILIGLFDALAGPSLPVRYPRLFLVTRWCSGEGNFVQSSRILGPDLRTVVLQGKEIPVRLPGAEASATNVEVFFNAEFREAGAHWVEISLDGDLVLRFPLRVNLLKPSGHSWTPPEAGGGAG